jgi:hypothetical protein
VNLKLKQLYLNRLEDDPANDADSFPEPQPPPDPSSELDLLQALVLLALVGALLWVLIVPYLGT